MFCTPIFNHGLQGVSGGMGIAYINLIDPKNYGFDSEFAYFSLLHNFAPIFQLHLSLPVMLGVCHYIGIRAIQPNEPENYGFHCKI